MSEFESLIKRVRVYADLPTIIKYHPASAIYLNEVTQKEYFKYIYLKPLLKKSKPLGEVTAVHAFNNELEFDTESPHSNNLLVMVKNLIEVEWQYHQVHLSILESPVAVESTRLLNELKNLFKMLEEVGKTKFNDETTGINKKERKLKGDSFKGNLNLVHLESQEELDIIELLIQNRQRKLNDPQTHSLPYHSIEYPTNTNTVEVALKLMQAPFKRQRMQKAFLKLVIEKIHAYFIGEIEPDRDDKIEIPKDEGVLIFFILSVFNLLDHQVEMNNATSRDQAVYVRSLLRSPESEEQIKFTNVK